MAAKKKSPQQELIEPSPAPSRQKPLVFISHDSRDADLAEAFGNLLIDVSGGTLKSFRSSDKKGSSGLSFGDEWYKAIMEQLHEATDVVALWTRRSIDRPWILYESGVAKGKLSTTVLGLALGIPLSDVITGPFGQFQNCADDQDSITTLVMQLLKRNPDADPREEAVRHQVSNFIVKKDETIKSLDSGLSKKQDKEESDIAKLFEEIKSMIRDIERAPLISNVSYGQEKMSRKFPPDLLEKMLRSIKYFSSRERISLLMIVASILRDSIPWLYEPVMEIYRALARGSAEEIDLAYKQFLIVTRLINKGPFEQYLYRINEDGLYIMHSVIKMIDSMMRKYSHTSLSGGIRKRKTLAEGDESD